MYENQKFTSELIAGTTLSELVELFSEDIAVQSLCNWFEIRFSRKEKN
jgi:hypothetical protein